MVCVWERLVDVLANEKADDDDGVFLDFSSIYQKPRNDVQEELSRRGYYFLPYLRSNFRVGCIILSEVPDGYTGPYWTNGLCYNEFLMSTLCQRIVNSKDPSVSQHMVPEWLVGWRARYASMKFRDCPDSDYFARVIKSWAFWLPAARVDAVGFVVTCAVANFRFVRCHYLRQLAARGGPSPRRQDLPRGTFVDGHVPAGGTLWVLSYPWSAKTHPSPAGEKVRELVRELDKFGASDDDVVFVDHMSLWQGDEVVPNIYVTQNKVKDFGAQTNGLVGLRDRTVSEQKEFKFALYETTRLYAFAGGSLPDGTYLKGCRVLVLPEIDDHTKFPQGGVPQKQLNTFCEPPRQEWKTNWGFTKSVPYEEGGWTCAEYSVANFCGTIHNRESQTVRALHGKRVWPKSVKDFAAMMDDNADRPVKFTKKGDKDAVRFNFWKYCFEFE